MNITIATRGSKLALWQSNTVKHLLQEHYPHIHVSLQTIQTKGDIILDTALSKIGDKSLFTKEIEQALLDKTADIAVHSLKDLPTVLPEGLCIGAVLPRADRRDALISKQGKALHELTADDLIATSSLRRKALLLAYNPALRIIDIRGNVDTRLQKMQNGYCDALIMATAGLQRLGLESHITEIIDSSIMLPAVSQGIICIECRSDNTELRSLLENITDTEASIMAQAERAFLHAMHGGCQLPLGCNSSISNNILTLTGIISNIDGTHSITQTCSGSCNNPEQVGKELAQLCYNAGAQAILDTIRND